MKSAKRICRFKQLMENISDSKENLYSPILCHFEQLTRLNKLNDNSLKYQLLYTNMNPLSISTYVELSWFCRCTTSSVLRCSACVSCLASWFTSATLEAVDVISCSKLSKRCFMMASSSTSSVTIIVVKNFSQKTKQKRW